MLIYESPSVTWQKNTERIKEVSHDPNATGHRTPPQHEPVTMSGKHTAEDPYRLEQEPRYSVLQCVTADNSWAQYWPELPGSNWKTPQWLWSTVFLWVEETKKNSDSSFFNIKIQPTWSNCFITGCFLAWTSAHWIWGMFWHLLPRVTHMLYFCCFFFLPGQDVPLCQGLSSVRTSK